MDRLASCYFCGVAVDAPLEEYPVVPRDVRPSVENQQTVVLCPECRRKLSTIVDSVVDAATDPDQTRLGGGAITGAAENPGPERPPERTTDDVESAADRPADSSLIEGFGHDDGPSLVDVEGAAGEDDADEAEDDADEAEDDADEAEDDADEAEDDADGAKGETSKAEGEDTVEDEAESPDEETADASGKGSPEREFSTSAYNRVIRLIQNREFPLDVAEITTIASSAYEIERRETETILDALADRGVIERDGEQLFRPEE